METYTLTEANAKLSFIIGQVAFAGKRIVIKRKGKSVAAVVPYEEYARKWAEEEHGGLILARGLWLIWGILTNLLIISIG